MDVDTSWGRKRPAEEDEQYLASKRYISEKFFNMRISQPEVPGANGAGPMWQGAKGRAAAAGDNFDIEGSTMSDEDLPPPAAAGGGAPLGRPSAGPFHNNAGGAGFMDHPNNDHNDGSSSDTDGDASAGGGRPTPHPFIRSASSKVDEKVDDWVRSSRHRMLADASVNSAPDLCRALILYKPVLPLAAAAAVGAGAETGEDEDGGGGGGGGEGGGDPTPSPQTGGDGGGETAPSPTAAAGLGAIGRRGGGRISSFSEQSTGSSTAEAAAGFTGGGARTERGRMDGGGQPQHHRRVAGSLFGRSPPPGLCTAQSGGDDAGGGMLMRDDSELGGGGAGGSLASVDEMDMDAGEEDAGAPPEPPTLTRIGRSRGAPTPDLTPQRAAWARTAGQRRDQAHGDKDSEEIGGGLNAAAATRPPVTAQGWARW